MPESRPLLWRALLIRELREHRASLLWTPLAIALLVSAGVFASVLLSSQSGFFSELLLPAIVESSGENSSIRIEMDNTGSGSYTVDTHDRSSGASAAPPAAGQLQDHVQALMRDNNVRLNPLFNALHSIMMLVLVLVSANYLLACLHIDRRDRSIWFWRSMPVSEWQEVLSKLATALLLVPAIYAAASVFAQCLLLLNTLFLVLQWDMDPVAIVLENIDWRELLLGQFLGFFRGIVSLLPVYAWLLLASAAARRSPFMTAVAPVVVVVALERVVVGSHFMATAVWSRIPGYTPGAGFSSVPLSTPSPLGMPALLGGAVFAIAALAVTVYFRRYRI